MRRSFCPCRSKTAMSRVHGAIRVAGTAFGRTAGQKTALSPSAVREEKESARVTGSAAAVVFCLSWDSFELERERQQGARGLYDRRAAGAAQDQPDRSALPLFGVGDHLPACSAGRTFPRSGQRGDCQRADFPSAPVRLHVVKQAAFGAHARGKDLAFLIGCRHDFPVIEQRGCADPEVRIGRIRLRASLGGTIRQPPLRLGQVLQPERTAGIRKSIAVFPS